MTARGAKRRVEPWREVLLDELSDETEDERRDFADPERNPFESDHGPQPGSDADDNPSYAGPKSPRVGSSDNDRRFDADKIDPATFSAANDPVSRRTPLRVDIHNPDLSDRALEASGPGQMVEDGHGFIVNDTRRPWKTPKRLGCAHCGEPLPRPDVSRYPCEFDPEATELELSLIGSDQGSDDRLGWPGKRSQPFFRGCQCSGCTLRHLVANGDERNRGGPRKVCSDVCGRLRGNEMKRWKAAVTRARKRGVEPPPEPEDKGLKMTRRSIP